MIDRNHDLPLVRQAELLRLSRSKLYYEPRPVPAAELAIMRKRPVAATLRRDFPSLMLGHGRRAGDAGAGRSAKDQS